MSVKIIGKQKVFLICDGLDEYDDDHNDLIYGILPKKFTYDNLEKTIFTSRLIPDLSFLKLTLIVLRMLDFSLLLEIKLTCFSLVQNTIFQK